MVSLTIEWSNLAGFPEHMEDFSTEAERSMFTRSFRSRFRSTPESISKWIEASPGVREAVKEVKGNIEKYQITLAVVLRWDGLKLIHRRARWRFMFIEAKMFTSLMIY